jgi:NADPH-dependent curcumin reductase CurA
MAANSVNRQIVLKRRPQGELRPEDLELIERPVSRPAAQQVLVRTLWLSLDPYMRLRAAGHERYFPAVPIGEPMIGGAVSRVVESHHPNFKTGDIVEEYSGWQDYALVDGHTLRKVNPSLAPISTALSVLGMPGLTAYLALIDVGRPEPGDTLVIGSAAGAVGAVVGQIGKIAGCRVVGIVGGPQKASYITNELGFDAVIDRHKDEIIAALNRTCPEGINIYFENLGGPITDAVYPRLAHRARVVVCGGITEYTSSDPKSNSHLQNILFSEARVGGFNIFSYASRYDDARRRLAHWFKQGRLKYREDIVEGLENAPVAFARLFEGTNFGKLLVRVSAE